MIPLWLLPMALFALTSTSLTTLAQTPSPDVNPPDFGPNVLILDPAAPDTQARVDAIFATQRNAQFGTGRHAILLKPGNHTLTIPVGFYTSVLGLGASPDDVTITGGVTSYPFLKNDNATCNFWRAAENLAIVPTGENKTNIWAVSQATGLRRIHVKGNLDLWYRGWSSGGFLADSKIDGNTTSGSQQQWLSRNSDLGTWRGGAFNMVFVGSDNAPTEPWPEKPYTVVAETPIIREKPYLVFRDGQYAVHLPALRRNARGTSWQSAPTPGKTIPLADFHLARPDKDTAASLNAALAAGKHLLFTPGIYPLDKPLRITRPDTIVLGLGYATLTATAGNPLITVADVPGVTLAGLLLEAGPTESPTLLELGTPGATASSGGADDPNFLPTFLFDLYCRSGGQIVGKTKSFVTIHSHHVVGDNLWLWRADHGENHSVGWTLNTTTNGLIVNGDDVTTYGLFVEHTQEYQVLWNGERGRTYFYQSEMPYDPPSQDAWMAGPKRGYASYKVADHVKAHEAWGFGVYSVFFAAPVVVDSPIEVPTHLEPFMHHLTTARFAGKEGSGFAHVLNDKGGDVIHSRTARHN